MRNIQIDYNKILFVEYDAKLSEQINLLLKDEYNLIFVNSNAEISFAFQLDPPDLILLDYADKKSLSLILEDENSKGIPILFFHDIDGEEIREVYTLERICETIYKPRIQIELLMRLKRVMHISQKYKELKRIKLDLEIDLKVQHLIESELTEKENRLATILDSVEAFIYIKDTHYRYQYANKKVCDMLGLPMDEIINKDDFDFFDEATAKNLRQNDRRIIDYGERIEEEEINTGKNGNITNAFLSVKLPLFREDGTVYALSGISTEITKHKQAEDRLKKALAQLEEQHTQLKSTQAQLVQAEKMAGLGTLVAGVAHEVNNPTNYIYLSSKALERDLLSFKEEVINLMTGSEVEIIKYFEDNFNKFQRSLSNIIDGGERIRMIVQDLRSFSRLDEAEKKHANITEIIDSSIRIAKTQYHKEIKISKNYALHGEIECYPAQLGQVFLNVLINACQAILQKKKEIQELYFGKINVILNVNKEEIEVIIEDNGCGMTEEVRTKIFEPFFTTKLVGQGTGLGMSISYGIIQKHNGNIKVESELNVGTKISISLPIGGI